MVFNYHPLCRALKLTHLCFADDLLMFCRGDKSSITVLLRAFATFSVASGLEMNREKSDIYFNGLGMQISNEILNLSGTGVQENSVMLVGLYWYCLNSIPFGLEFLSFPLTVIDRIERICRNYLWSGGDQYIKSPPVSWEKVCKAKKYGGLGICDCRLWNVALIGKYVWWLVNKADHLWIKWVKEQMKAGFNNGTWANQGHYSVSDVQWRLMTKDRLLKFGIINDAVCDMCLVHQEDHHHLLYGCPFSVQCWILFRDWLNINMPLVGVLEWVVQWRCRSLMKKQMIMAAMAAMI
ncbi:uncharacterized protein LOC141588602 [Silene latifolia]|uniref:uncharacterized protein LOC141588602 n=1 Tax=Silene latifolia TaxID=37657 RepID=UPI003D77BDD8